MKEHLRLVAIIRNIDPCDVIPITDILMQEGICSVEVSLSEPDKGFSCLEEMRKRYNGSELFLGAGTVTKRSEVDRLAELGVRYFFTPGFDGGLIDYAAKTDMLPIPGVLTPSEVQQAVIRGLRIVKLFPACAMPCGYIKNLRGPFPNTGYIAVGGVNAQNLTKYYDAGFLGAGIGSSLVPQGADRSQLDAIRESAGKYAQIAAEYMKKGV